MGDITLSVNGTSYEAQSYAETMRSSARRHRAAEEVRDVLRRTGDSPEEVREALVEAYAQIDELSGGSEWSTAKDDLESAKDDLTRVANEYALDAETKALVERAAQGKLVEMGTELLEVIRHLCKALDDLRDEKEGRRPVRIATPAVSAARRPRLGETTVPLPLFLAGDAANDAGSEVEIREPLPSPIGPVSEDDEQKPAATLDAPARGRRGRKKSPTTPRSIQANARTATSEMRLRALTIGSK